MRKSAAKQKGVTSDRTRVEGNGVGEVVSGFQYKRILGTLRAMVLRGEFRPGERLSELPLAAQLGSSRTPIRLALESLAREGLLEANPGSGFTIKTYSIVEVYDAIELRGVLEGMAGRFACERAGNAGLIEALAQCSSKLRKLPRSKGPSGSDPDFVLNYAALNDRFHAILVDLANSTVIKRAWLQLQVIPYATPSGTLIPEAMDQVLETAHEQHEAIIDALRRRDGVQAEAIAREHARIGLKNLDVVLRNTSLITVSPQMLVKNYSTL